MEAHDAARIFHDWANEEGLLSEGPAAIPRSSAPEIALVRPITALGKHVLRSKQVMSIGFSSHRREVLCFLKRPAPLGRKTIAALPASVDDVQIKYRQGSPEAIGSEPPQPFGGPAYSIRVVGQSNHYACGSSVSVGNYRDGGTMGCLVRDAQSVLFGLSNNHVTGGCSFAGINLPIVAPGICDVVPNNLAPSTIGFHAAALPLVAGSADNVDATKNLDAAIFRIANEQMVSSFQGTAYDTPTVAGDLVADLEVEKVGRTTQHTKGKVLTQQYGAFPIRYAVAHYGFAGSVYFLPVFDIVGHGQAFADNGDSGSLITTIAPEGQRIAVGIVVGGRIDKSAPGERITVALPILPILQGFGVTLVGGHNV